MCLACNDEVRASAAADLRLQASKKINLEVTAKKLVRGNLRATEGLAPALDLLFAPVLIIAVSFVLAILAALN